MSSLIHNYISRVKTISKKKSIAKLVEIKENLKFPIFEELDVLNYKILDFEKNHSTGFIEERFDCLHF